MKRIDCIIGFAAAMFLCVALAFCQEERQSGNNVPSPSGKGSNVLVVHTKSDPTKTTRLCRATVETTDCCIFPGNYTATYTI